jgi:transcriptional regulator of acetoin/glycerol metabolism
VTDGPRIELEALPEEVSAVLRPRVTRGTEAQLSYREVVDLARDRASREYLIALMQELGGNVTEAARRAGVERESLHRCSSAMASGPRTSSRVVSQPLRSGPVTATVTL